MKTVLASSIATLDSNVVSGGGTDVTEQLQSVLDQAWDDGIHLIVDGAALIHGLVIHSHTTVECVSSDCGFYMADYANRPMFRNDNWNFQERTTHDICFLGGTYNHNCTHQAHSVPFSEFPIPERKIMPGCPTEHDIYLMEFYGVENFKISGVKFRNQRTYTVELGNFLNVTIENSVIDMAEHVHPSNQDGFHFSGPGRYLTIRNVRGCTGDDFINIGPDEFDGVSSITDVLIDGVYFTDTCQGIRMLSRGTGMLDRVTVRNVSGTYRTFAFSINPFFHADTFGNYGDLYFENIDLRQIEATYNYTPLTFFQIGGNCHCITLKNIRFHMPVRNSLLFDIGRPFFYQPCKIQEADGGLADEYLNCEWMSETARPHIDTFILDGLTVTGDSRMDNTNILELRYAIDHLIVKNVQIFRTDDSSCGGCLVQMQKEAEVKVMLLEDIFAEKLSHILYAEAGHQVGLLHTDNVILEYGDTVIQTDGADVTRFL